MKKEYRIVCIFFAIVASLGPVSCERTIWMEDVALEASCTVTPSGKMVFKPVVCGLDRSMDGTKSILGDDVESIESGCQLIVFNRDTRELEGVFQCDGSRGSDWSVELNSAFSYDFFLIGNLWFLDSSGNRKNWKDLFDQSGISPSVASDMENPSKMPYYRMDGEVISGTSLRTQTFAECAIYGIPYAGKVENVSELDLDGQGRFNIAAKRLFAKEVVTVNHSGLDGGSNPDIFRNGTLYLKQVNCRMHPFISGVKAESAADMMSEADCYATMSNANNTKFILYLPENAQGTGSSSSAATKTLDKAPSASYATYIEFKGAFDKNASGLDGSLTYRFCLGADATNDYSVVRNTVYSVQLGFKAGSIYNPVWKVDNNGGISDSGRMLTISETAAGTSVFADGQVMTFNSLDTEGKSYYAYYNKDNVAGNNQYSRYIDPWTAGYEPADVMHYALKVDLPTIPGASVTFDQAAGKISVTVTSPSSFVPDREYDVKFSLVTSGGQVVRTRTTKIKTLPEPYYITPLSVGTSSFTAAGGSTTVSGGRVMQRVYDIYGIEQTPTDKGSATLSVGKNSKNASFAGSVSGNSLTIPSLAKTDVAAGTYTLTASYGGMTQTLDISQGENTHTITEGALVPIRTSMQFINYSDEYVREISFSLEWFDEYYWDISVTGDIGFDSENIRKIQGDLSSNLLWNGCMGMIRDFVSVNIRAILLQKGIYHRLGEYNVFSNYKATLSKTDIVSWSSGESDTQTQTFPNSDYRELKETTQRNEDIPWSQYAPLGVDYQAPGEIIDSHTGAAFTDYSVNAGPEYYYNTTGAEKTYTLKFICTSKPSLNTTFTIKQDYKH